MSNHAFHQQWRRGQATSYCNDQEADSRNFPLVPEGAAVVVVMSSGVVLAYGEFDSPPLKTDSIIERPWWILIFLSMQSCDNSYSSTSSQGSHKSMQVDFWTRRACATILYTVLQYTNPVMNHPDALDNLQMKWHPIEECRTGSKAPAFCSSSELVGVL